MKFENNETRGKKWNKLHLLKNTSMPAVFAVDIII